MDYNFSFWFVFHFLILVFLLVDLLFLEKDGKSHSPARLVLFTLLWVALSLGFNIWIFFAKGPQQALTFFGAYLLEKSLSVDNLFVFLLIFSTMKIPKEHQKKILFWGVIGAILVRLGFILLGSELLQHFTWMYYIFGTFLCLGGLRFLVQACRKKEESPHWLSMLAKAERSAFWKKDTSRFFVLTQRKLFITKAFITLIVVEIADLIFAVDSVPAVLALTSDVFIAYTSNVFAILGLRALYLVLSYYKERIPHFSFALGVILLFIGGKMILSNVYLVSASVTVLFVLLALLVGFFTAFFRKEV